MKRCTKCGIEKPEEEFAMQPSRGRRRAECKACKAIADKAWLEKRRANPPKPRSTTKRCKKCKEIKPIGDFSPGRPGYHHANCRKCEIDIRKEKRREQYLNDPTGRFYWPFKNDKGIMVKRCSYCHAEKPLTDFYKNGKRGHHGKCKECDKTLKKLVYDNNPERYRAYSREWMKKHPDEHRARWMAWETANKERRLRYHRQRHIAHHERDLAYNRLRHSKETPAFRHEQYMLRREYIRDYGRNWRQSFPDKVYAQRTLRRAREMNATRSERINRRAIIERDKWTCYLCGMVCTPQNVSLDHVIPLARGGDHASDNLRVACRSCNSRKGAKPPHGFLA